MKEHLFGTDGIRGTVGHYPLTLETIVQLGKAIGQWSCSLTSAPRILLGHDTRISYALCKSALKTGLLQSPVHIDDAGIVPTPMIYQCMKDKGYTIGIAITASHNPYQDNGIKIFKGTSGKLTLADEEAIMDLFYQKSTVDCYDTIGTEAHIPHAYAWYMDRVSSYFEKNYLRKLTIVVDCAHGAYFEYAPQAFEAFGATVKTINAKPDGKNINALCGSLHPSSLQQAMYRYNADIGFAFDGDGDRIIAITKDGVLKDGDDIIAFLLKHPRYRQNKIIVGTLMSNQGLAHAIEQQSRTFIRTSVGDKHVLSAMKEASATLGGEPSGHIILRDFSEAADGLFTALRILETAIQTNDWALSSFKKFPQISMNIPIVVKKDLTQEPLASLIKNSEQELNGGRIIVRYSGTEPVLRVTVEDPDATRATEIGTLLSSSLTQHLTKDTL